MGYQFFCDVTLCHWSFGSLYFETAWWSQNVRNQIPCHGETHSRRLDPQIIFCSTIQHAPDNSLISATYFEVSNLSCRCHESIFNLDNKSILQSCLSVLFAIVGNKYQKTTNESCTAVGL